MTRSPELAGLLAGSGLEAGKVASSTCRRLYIDGNKLNAVAAAVKFGKRSLPPADAGSGFRHVSRADATQ